ncbi:hypothetical protein N7470_009337 [Penicillium chermesinum]|nr:hypothetical protein N7470_009337 [Penicillium chermesinum]
MSRNVLITAASGHIGEELVPILLPLNHVRLILPTSNASRLQTKFSSKPHFSDEECVIEEGSVANPGWFQGLLTKYHVDTVFCCLTGEDELFTTMNSIDCMIKSGTVKHLIYLSAGADFHTPEGVAQLYRDSTSAHVMVKVVIEQKIRFGHLPFSWTILRPMLFFVNDIRTKQAMLTDGLYAEPLPDKPLSRVAPGDIALAVKNIVLDTTGKWKGQHIYIGSAKGYTGPEIAKIWSSALGKEIRMLDSGESGLQHVEDHLSRIGRPNWGRDIRLMYETFALRGFEMPESEYPKQVELLGKEPDDYENWVKRQPQAGYSLCSSKAVTALACLLENGGGSRQTSRAIEVGKSLLV